MTKQVLALLIGVSAAITVYVAIQILVFRDFLKNILARALTSEK